MTHREQTPRVTGTRPSLFASAFGALLTLFGLVPHCSAQAAGINQGGPGYLHEQAGTNPRQGQPSTEATAKVDEMRRAERQRRLATDAAKLLQLSNELKIEMDKTPRDQLSLEVIRKAEEIEKLARDMKQWMKS